MIDVLNRVITNLQISLKQICTNVGVALDEYIGPETEGVVEPDSEQD